MYEIVFIILAISIMIITWIAWTKNIPVFFAISSVLLFLTAIFIMVDGGIELQTSRYIYNGSNTIVQPILDSNVMLSFSYSSSPLLWSINQIMFFFGFMLMAYSIGLVARKGAIYGRSAR